MGLYEKAILRRFDLSLILRLPASVPEHAIGFPDSFSRSDKRLTVMKKARILVYKWGKWGNAHTDLNVCFTQGRRTKELIFVKMDFHYRE